MLFNYFFIKLKRKVKVIFIFKYNFIYLVVPPFSGRKIFTTVSLIAS